LKSQNEEFNIWKAKEDRRSTAHKEERHSMNCGICLHEEPSQQAFLSEVLNSHGGDVILRPWVRNSRR
jgi:hypothetical protein